MQKVLIQQALPREHQFWGNGWGYRKTSIRWDPEAGGPLSHALAQVGARTQLDAPRLVQAALAPAEGYKISIAPWLSGWLAQEAYPWRCCQRSVGQH